jgi:hypothetical protein
MIDHLIYAAPGLPSAIEDFEREYGVAPSLGGRHAGFGTRNALVGLGPDIYLEIMALDPEQHVPPSRRFFGLDDSFAPRFAGWCARASRPLAETVEIARDAGCDLGDILSMSRTRPDGTTLSWTLTSPFAAREGGVLPFYIDWGNSAHPASILPPALLLVSLTAVHPDADRIRAVLAALGEREVRVEEGPEPLLDVTLRNPATNREWRRRGVQI